MTRAPVHDALAIQMTPSYEYGGVLLPNSGADVRLLIHIVGEARPAKNITRRPTRNIVAEGGEASMFHLAPQHSETVLNGEVRVRSNRVADLDMQSMPLRPRW